MRGFRLSTVLRARKAAEDTARAEAARARVAAEATHTQVRAYEQDLAGRVIAPDPVTGRALSAALQARQALASALTEAVLLAEHAEETLSTRTDEVMRAAIRRRTLEHLAERHALAERVQREAAEEAALDDIAGAAGHPRTRGGHRR